MKNRPTRYTLGIIQSCIVHCGIRDTYAQVLMAFLNMSYVVAASVLKYPVKEPTIRPTILSIISRKKKKFARGVVPKMMFMMGIVTPAPTEVKIAANKSSRSSHVEKEKMRCDEVSQ